MNGPYDGRPWVCADCDTPHDYFDRPIIRDGAKLCERCNVLRDQGDLFEAPGEQEASR